MLSRSEYGGYPQPRIVERYVECDNCGTSHDVMPCNNVICEGRFCSDCQGTHEGYCQDCSDRWDAKMMRLLDDGPRELIWRAFTHLIEFERTSHRWEERTFSDEDWEGIEEAFSFYLMTGQWWSEDDAAA